MHENSSDVSFISEEGERDGGREGGRKEKRERCLAVHVAEETLGRKCPCEEGTTHSELSRGPQCLSFSVVLLPK